jgi:hypothetical protein
MKRDKRQTISRATQLLGMFLGLIVAPIATPALIWATLATDLPPVLVILQLFIMAAVSNWLSHTIIRACKAFEGGGGDLTIGKSWNTEAPQRLGFEACRSQKALRGLPAG